MKRDLILSLAFILSSGFLHDRVLASNQQKTSGTERGTSARPKRLNENIERAKMEAATNPSSAEAQLRLGEAYRSTEGNHAEEAIEAYKRALALRPDYSEAFKGLAWGYGVLKDFQKQLDSLDHAITLNPNDAEAYYQLGLAHENVEIDLSEIKSSPIPNQDELKVLFDARRRRATLSAAAYKKAITIKPDYAEAYCGLGSAYLTLQLYNESIQAHKQAIEYDPKNPTMRVALGYVYLVLGDHDAAMEQNKRAKELIDHFDPPLKRVYELAVMMQLERIKEAIKER